MMWKQTLFGVLTVFVLSVSLFYSSIFHLTSQAPEERASDDQISLKKKEILTKNEGRTEERIQKLRFSRFVQVCAAHKHQLHHKIKNMKGHHINLASRHFYVDSDHGILHALVPKTATTTWRKLQIYYSRNFNKNQSLDAIQISEKTLTKYGVRSLNTMLSISQIRDSKWMDRYYSFVIGRNPFERLISAYGNKFYPGNKYFHRRYGKGIISRYRKNASKESLGRGHDVTFPEFIHYIIDASLEKPHENFEPHWIPQHLLSLPCIMNFTHIGKFESLNDDISHILKTKYKVSDVSESGVLQQVKATQIPKIIKYFEEIPESHIAKLKEIYKFDFLFYNYSTDLPTLKS